MNRAKVISPDYRRVGLTGKIGRIKNHDPIDLKHPGQIIILEFPDGRVCSFIPAELKIFGVKKEEAK